ncbi:hypothetical protein BKI52_38085 [marine bacterium AO1-C]|nr:hypothetical protein BKI52_38085 [marine bacterium AO1-C]
MAFLVLWNAEATQAQNKKLPKGKWLTQVGMGMMNMKLMMNFVGNTIEMDAVMNGQKQKEKSVVLEILASEIKKKKGKMLLKEKGKDRYGIALFKKLSKDEIIMMPPEPTLSERKQAEEFYKNAEESIRKEMVSKIPTNNPTIDMYEVGFVFRTEKRIEKLNSLPDMPELDKKGVLGLMDDMIEIYKDPKNAAIMGNPMSSLRLMEQLFIKKGYNPFTSLSKMMKSQMKFAQDKDIQKKSVEMQELMRKHVKQKKY